MSVSEKDLVGLIVQTIDLCLKEIYCYYIQQQCMRHNE